MNESFIKKLLGVSDIIPDTILNGEEFNDKMLTLIGYKRLKNIEKLLNRVVKNNIPGDFIETGVWRGGACMYARHILNQLNSDKKVFVADSFEGCPPPEDHNIHDAGDNHYSVGFLSVSQEEVEYNFKKFELLDNVIFIKGWFKDTLPLLNNQFSIIRLDGDLYSSTMDSLNNLYHKLSPGGYCIIDDYNAVHGCNEATKEFIAKNNIKSEIINIDKTAIYWEK